MKLMMCGIFLVAAQVSLFGQCEPICKHPQDNIVPVDEFALQIGSASGAQGDVVEVLLSLEVSSVNPKKSYLSLSVRVSHDSEIAEVVGRPLLGEEFLSMVGMGYMNYESIDFDGCLPEGVLGHGFYLFGGLHEYMARFPSEVPMPIATIYYRLKGNPGDTGALDFSPNVGGLGCSYSTIHTVQERQGEIPIQRDYASTRNIAGTLTVLEGPATHPDRPPEPPEATVYPSKPTDEEVNFQVRMTGAAARPGDRGVAVDVYASADVEYTAMLIPIDFDERYLRIQRVEDYFPTGGSVKDNLDDLPGSNVEEGSTVIFSGLGIYSRRLAAAGEEVHVATLYFDVLEAASEVTETALRVIPVTSGRYPPGFYNQGPWIDVRHIDGWDATKPEVHSQIAPITITQGALFLNPYVTVSRGDSNFDGQVDISDPVSLLDFLFLGGQAPACPGAADFNMDRAVDIADPIALLNTLFLGREAQLPAEVPCN